MDYKKPCYVTRVDTFLPKDEIRPYGEELYIISERQRKEIALRLLGEAGKPKKKKKK